VQDLSLEAGFVFETSYDHLASTAQFLKLVVYYFIQLTLPASF